MNYSAHGCDALNQALNNSYQKTDPTKFCYTVPQDWKLISPKEKPKTKVNYVIATWSGKRRKGNNQILEDPTAYIQQHLDHIRRLDNNLTQITIMVPHNPKESPRFTDFISQIPSKVVGTETDISILRRPNEGQSYGSYVDCYKTYTNQFDYYIFAEDDYVPAQHNFDQILIQMFNACQSCGYLCSRVCNYPPTTGRPHAAISNGITSSSILKSLVDKLGDIPCGRASTRKYKYAAVPQLEFSWGFLDSKHWLYDYSTHYCAPYHHVGSIQHYGSIKKPPLFVPLQTKGLR